MKQHARKTSPRRASRWKWPALGLLVVWVVTLTLVVWPRTGLGQGQSLPPQQSQVPIQAEGIKQTGETQGPTQVPTLESGQQVPSKPTQEAIGGTPSGELPSSLKGPLTGAGGAPGDFNAPGGGTGLQHDKSKNAMMLAHRARLPHLYTALKYLDRAKREIRYAHTAIGLHKNYAMEHVDSAMKEIKQGIAYVEEHY